MVTTSIKHETVDFDNVYSRVKAITDTERSVRITPDNQQMVHTIEQFSDYGLMTFGKTVDFPAPFIRKVHETNPILANAVVKDRVQEYFKAERPDFFTRSFNDKVCGVVSHKYAYFDDNQVMEILEGSPLAKMGFQNAIITPERFHLRAVDAENPFRIGTDDSELFFAYFIDNSMVGQSSFKVQLGIYRLACTNGMIVPVREFTICRQVHRGSKDIAAEFNESVAFLAEKQDAIKALITGMANEQATKRQKKKQRSKSGGSSMSGKHMVFYGSAGTGKTTVARIITGFLYKHGYIKENKCIEIDGNFLKAGEDSATKTRMIIQKAYGGVLFIDEAYTIIDGSGGYGKEVVATLIKEMEDNRDRLIIILAGYRNDMKRLLDTNEGFKSRVKEYLNFPDYNTQEMKDIFTAMAHSEGFVVSEEALDNFEIRCEKERKLSSFANGRTVRNILDETLDRHALNYGKGILSRKESHYTEAPKELKEWRNDKLKFVLCGCDVSTSVNKNAL